MRPEVEIYEDGSRCKVDGIWYKPNDPVVVLDAALGQYHAKYLFLANDEVITLVLLSCATAFILRHTEVRTWALTTRFHIACR